jgi:hypothetical protein
LQSKSLLIGDEPRLPSASWTRQPPVTLIDVASLLIPRFTHSPTVLVDQLPPLKLWYHTVVVQEQPALCGLMVAVLPAYVTKELAMDLMFPS